MKKVRYNFKTRKHYKPSCPQQGEGNIVAKEAKMNQTALSICEMRSTPPVTSTTTLTFIEPFEGKSSSEKDVVTGLHGLW